MRMQQTDVLLVLRGAIDTKCILDSSAITRIEVVFPHPASQQCK